jgi:hypothetical protein
MGYVAENYDKDATRSAFRGAANRRYHESEPPAALTKGTIEIADDASQMRHQVIMTREPEVRVVSLFL